jgi:nucleotide-binding universal stress UspA family protein
VTSSTIHHSNEAITPVAVDLRRILVATDFTVEAENAIRFAADVARRYDADIRLVHVLESADREAAFEKVTANEAIRTAEERLKKNEVYLKGIRHECQLLAGNPAAAIELLTRDISIDVVVLGTHGSEGVRKIVFGSTAEQVFRHVQCPVLTMGPRTGSIHPNRELRHILFPTDMLSEQPQALAHAVSLASTRGARLTLLCVLAGTRLRIPSRAKAFEASFVDHLRRMVAADANPPCNPEIVVVYSDAAADTVLTVATDIGTDLIVLGVHPEQDWSLQLSRKAYHIVARSSCPVLTVREADDRY